MTVDNLLFVETPSLNPIPLAQVALHLHPDDNIAVAKTHIQTSTILELTSGEKIMMRQLVPSGHKFALKPVGAGETVRRYGQVIGFALADIQPGDHVHVHNLAVQDFARDYAFGSDVRPLDFVPEDQRRQFMGYRRADGRVGTRNYIAILASVNCSAHVIREIAHYYTPERLAAYPN
ncbi:MAG: altronate dehydratase family protein, partial [Anaerolineae bacterium]|nr:altronate dehydratase family protein [Anaerolineae bacterium]